MGPVELEVLATRAREARDYLAELRGVTKARAEVPPEIAVQQEAAMEKLDLLKSRVGIGCVGGVFAFLAWCMLYELIQTLRHAP